MCRLKIDFLVDRVSTQRGNKCLLTKQGKYSSLPSNPGELSESRGRNINAFLKSNKWLKNKIARIIFSLVPNLGHLIILDFSVGTQGIMAYSVLNRVLSEVIIS